MTKQVARGDINIQVDLMNIGMIRMVINLVS